MVLRKQHSGKKDRIAVSRRFRLRAVIPRFFSRSFRNAVTSGASISSKVNWEGGLFRRLCVNCKSRRKVSR